MYIFHFFIIFSAQNLPKKSVSGCPSCQKKNKLSRTLMVFTFIQRKQFEICVMEVQWDHVNEIIEMLLKFINVVFQ